MPFQLSLWQVESDQLVTVPTSRPDLEDRLEEWIANDPSILGMELLLIGRQVQTQYGGRIDLLGIDQLGNPVIIELKRDKTPRDVVAQILDYAAWVKNLSFDELEAITSKYLKRSLVSAYSEFYNDEDFPDTVNNDHSMVIVASELDDSSERIVQYLATYDMNINTVFFNFFKAEAGDFLGRAWLMDPQETQERSARRKQAPWTGYWFVNVGEGDHRNWDDNRKYGYIGAGQGDWYSRALKRLKPGAKIFAYMKGLGYVGYGEVTEEACRIQDFVPDEHSVPLLELPLRAERADENADNPEKSEWVVRVNWLKTYDRENAQTRKGIFANQNIACQLRDAQTAEFLKRAFDVE